MVVRIIPGQNKGFGNICSDQCKGQLKKGKGLGLAALYTVEVHILLLTILLAFHPIIIYV